MKQEIIARQVAAMGERGWDAIVSVSPENFAYVAGFVVPSQPLLRHRHAAAIVAADSRTALFCVDMEESTVRRNAPDQPLAVWAEFGDDAMRVLAGQLQEMGLGRGRIGIEFDYLPAGDLHRLRECLPHADLQPCEQALARMRQIKTADEIALLRRLSRIADQSISDAYASAGVGSSEMDIAAALTRGVYTLGADAFKLMIVATGERSQLPNVGPTQRTLAPRDVCRVEIFAVKDGYQAGVCRTAVVQEAPEHAEDIWARLVDCKYQTLQAIRPGAGVRDIYRAYLGQMKASGLPPISFLGHGIGLHLHEEPYLAIHDDTVLQAGMVLGIEPLVYRSGYGFGMQNKDMVLVTPTGSELLSDHTDTDRLIVV